MKGRTNLKLIIEKGPREGETLNYSSSSVIKVGRVVRGNTIAIKDSGISSKHLTIQFDNQLSHWNLCDLDSSNGTLLNGHILQPHVPSHLNDGDTIKIGELTSIVVKIESEAEVEVEDESNVRMRRNPRRQGKSQPEVKSELENEKNELGLGFGGNLGENEVKEPVKKRNLRGKAKKDVDVETRNEVEIIKEEVSFVSTINELPESLNAGGVGVDVSVPVERKMTRGRKKKTVELVALETDLDKGKSANVVVPVVGRVTRGRRKAVLKESLESLKNESESLQLEKVKDNGLAESLDANDKPGEENVVSTQEGCDGKDVMADESLLKGKEVAEELELMKDGCENRRWELEKMTLGDFFDYLEVQLPKEIYEKSEKIMADLEEKARKCHEFRLQRSESAKGKVGTD